MNNKEFSTFIAEKYVSTFDYKWYSLRYMDAPSDIKQAFSQFRELVLTDGRNPNGYFLGSYYLQKNPKIDFSNKDPYLHFLGSKISNINTPHPLINLNYLKNAYPEIEYGYEVIELLMSGKVDFTCEWFSRSYYRDMNPDLVGISDIENHYISHGINEKRKPSPLYFGVTSSTKGIPYHIKVPTTLVDEFKWDGDSITIHKLPLTQNQLFQLLKIGEIDSSIFAPGAFAIPGLNFYSYDDLDTRDLIDFDGLKFESDIKPDIVIAIPRISVGGGEKYASQFARVLANNFNKKVLVLVTESDDDETTIDFKNHSLANFRGVRIVSLHKHIKGTWKKDNLFALYMQFLKPKKIVVFNSDTAFKAVSRYGKFLSNFAEITVAFFSESPYSRGAPFASVYLDKIIENSRVLADNGYVLEKLKQRVSSTFLSKLIKIQQYVDPLPKLDIYKNFEPNSGKFKLLWIGRWEIFKNVHLFRSTSLRK